jgi:hypothetical protein
MDANGPNSDNIRYSSGGADAPDVGHGNAYVTIASNIRQGRED